jgi:hypothetical protein
MRRVHFHWSQNSVFLSVKAMFRYPLPVTPIVQSLIDEGANPKFDGDDVLAVTWSEEASRDQRLDFISPNRDSNDSLTPPLSLAVTAHAFGG